MTDQPPDALLAPARIMARANGISVAYATDLLQRVLNAYAPLDIRCRHCIGPITTRGACRRCVARP